MTALRALPRWAPVLALLALAALVRVASMFTGTLSGDDSTVALVAKHVLSGEDFPAFFYRQAYMGSLNGIHLVPALYLFGPSALVVRLNAIAWSLLFPLGLYLLGRRIFDESSGRVTLALAALPPFLVTYWSTVAEPHFETNVFGVFLLLLALTALTARSEPARARALAVLGLLAGLAAWTNVKIVVVLGPILTLLLLRHPRLPISRGGALLAGGFLLGGLPAWLYYLIHGEGTEGTPGSVGTVLRVGVDVTLRHLQEFWYEVILDLLGTYYWRLNTPLRWAALALNCVIYALGVAFALDRLARSRRERPASARAWGLALLLLTLVASLGAVYLSGHAAGTLAHASRYALPAYLALFVCTGALVVRASRRWRAVGAGLLAFLLLFGAWTHVRFLWPISPELRAAQSGALSVRETIRERLDAGLVEALYVEDTLGAIAWAFLLDRPTVSAVARDVYVPNAVAADAAERIAIVATRDEKRIAADLAAVGATWKETLVRRWSLFEDVRVPDRGYRMVPRSDWRVTGDARTPASVADGDLATAWPRPTPDGTTEPLVLDLGHAHRIARVIFWPSLPTSEVFPLRIAGSDDGRRWETLGTVPARPSHPTFVASGRPVFRPRNGWLELVLTPRPLRYLQIEPAGDVGSTQWGVAEIQVYEATADAPPNRVGVDVLVERLRVQEVSRLLADPVVSARVARATHRAVSTLVANGVIDNHGTSPPERLARPVRLRAHDALLVPSEDVPELRQRLDAAGARHVTEPLGDHVLVRVLAPLASTAPCRVPVRRMTTPEPAADGGSPYVSLEAALGEETLVSGIRLLNPAGPPWSPFPDPKIAVSRDGRVWDPVNGGRAVPDWAWAGRTLFAAPAALVEVAFDPVRARHVRLVIPSGVGHARLLCVRHTRAPDR